ncbi:hypothetical protein D3C72_2050240 [compost metagenome]
MGAVFHGKQGAVELLQHSSHQRHDLLAHRGGGNVARRPLKQWRPDGLLEFLDASRERRLGNVQRFGRPMKAFKLDHGLKGAEIQDFTIDAHIAIIPPNIAFNK